MRVPRYRSTSPTVFDASRQRDERRRDAAGTVVCRSGAELLMFGPGDDLLLQFFGEVTEVVAVAGHPDD